MTEADSVLEYLTAKNPDLEHPKPETYTVGSSRRWYRPRLVKHWDDFNFQTLEAIYEGALMDAARQKGRRLPYPVIIPKVDCDIQNEKCTTHIYTKWNHSIVSNSLNCVEEFHPCLWSPFAENVGTKALKGIPDAGGRLPLPPLDENSAHPSEARRLNSAQLHLEYKPASKWTSATMSRGGTYVNDNGTWRSHTKRTNAIMPVKQAYTYCVISRCRYGCILTGKEAVVFRIKPLAVRHTTVPPDNQPRRIDNRLINNGLMEFVSIPWDKGRGQDSVEFRDMTVNLALWFMHILAGNHHEVAWEYRALESETLLSESKETAIPSDIFNPRYLRNSVQSLDNEPTSALTSFSSLKRGRDSEDEEEVTFSFSGSMETPSEPERRTRARVRRRSASRSGSGKEGRAVTENQGFSSRLRSSSRIQSRPNKKLRQ